MKKALNEIVSLLGVLLPSRCTCALYRLLGHKIGRSSRLALFSYVHAEDITVGNDVEIRSFVFIRVKRLVVGNNSIISFGTQIKGGQSFVTKGNNFIGVHCLVNCEEDVSLGYYSGFGPRCNVYSHGSFLPVILGYPAKFEKVVLEDYVWVGMAVTVLPGVHIESNCIINPGVVLKSRIKANSLIEIAPTAFQTYDLNRLKRFARKKSSLDYYREMIAGFLAQEKLTYEYRNDDQTFVVGDTYVFRCAPENETIELLYGRQRSLAYDFKTLSTRYSRLRVHRQFLHFLRRRYGVIFDITY